MTGYPPHAKDLAEAVAALTVRPATTPPSASEIAEIVDAWGRDFGIYLSPAIRDALVTRIVLAGI